MIAVDDADSAAAAAGSFTFTGHRRRRNLFIGGRRIDVAVTAGDDAAKIAAAAKMPSTSWLTCR